MWFERVNITRLPVCAVAQINQCTSGSVALIVAIALPILFGATALAVDYGRIVSARSWLQSTLDAATMAALSEDTRSAAQSKFDAYVAGKTADLGAGTVTAKLTFFSSNKVSTSGSIAVPMTLAGVLGTTSNRIEARSSAERGVGYQSIYFAVDMSSSMGVAATEADRIALENLTKPYSTAAYGSRLPQGCAFGCHRREGWEPGTKTVYQMAREAGIRLREDELKAQFGGLVDLLLDPNDPAVSGSMRTVSVIGFSGRAEQLIRPSSSAGDVKASFDLFRDTDKYETAYAEAFTEFKRLLGDQGDGTSASSPQKTLVLISDGIESRDAFFSQSAIKASLCSDLKSRGFRLAVVEIKYPKLVSNALYEDTVLPVETAISPGLEACASPGWYFQATNNSDVPAKFAEFKSQILARSSRLTR
ncbi:MAG: VWA domain-containing protein [Hyphomicrobiaceae bacterium]